METEGSLPLSQVATTRPYPEPGSIQFITLHLTAWRFILAELYAVRNRHFFFCFCFFNHVVNFLQSYSVEKYEWP